MIYIFPQPFFPYHTKTPAPPPTSASHNHPPNTVRTVTISAEACSCYPPHTKSRDHSMRFCSFASFECFINVFIWLLLVHHFSCDFVLLWCVVSLGLIIITASYLYIVHWTLMIFDHLFFSLLFVSYFIMFLLL